MGTWSELRTSGAFEDAFQLRHAKGEACGVACRLGFALTAFCRFATLLGEPLVRQQVSESTVGVYLVN